MSGEGLSARHRGEHVAPWLVMLSEHMPEIDEIGGVSTLGCSCGATRTMYVGHIAGVIADRAARRESEAAEKARTEVDAGWDEWMRLTVTHLAVLGRIDGGCGRTVVEALTRADSVAQGREEGRDGV